MITVHDEGYTDMPISWSSHRDFDTDIEFRSMQMQLYAQMMGWA